MFLIDTHLHIYDLIECFLPETPPLETLPQTLFCTSSHCLSEFERTKLFCQSNNLAAYYSFGIHPQLPVRDELSTVERLSREKKIHAIGEIGFDLYNNEFRATFTAQQELWREQLRLARFFSLPVILHLRKANHLIFAQTAELKKLPAVIFHGWSGSVTEAAALLKRGVNAYFSLGKALLRGQKTVLQMAACFPLNRLLTETDAPYMNLKGEAFSHAADIRAVIEKLAKMRIAAASPHTENLQQFLTEELAPQLEKNFRSIFTQ